MREASHLDDDDLSITVDQAGQALGCDASTVRALLRDGQLVGHRIGKGANPRGVRVSLASVRAYKRDHAIVKRPEATRPVDSPAHRQAVEFLRQRGVLR